MITQVHSEAEQWVLQAADLARYKGEMRKNKEENRQLKLQLGDAERDQKVTTQAIIPVCKVVF